MQYNLKSVSFDTLRDNIGDGFVVTDYRRDADEMTLRRMTGLVRKAAPTPALSMSPVPV